MKNTDWSYVIVILIFFASLTLSQYIDRVYPKVQVTVEQKKCEAPK